jgi:hypothetical protein
LSNKVMELETDLTEHKYWPNYLYLN